MYLHKCLDYDSSDYTHAECAPVLSPLILIFTFLSVAYLCLCVLVKSHLLWPKHYPNTQVCILPRRVKIPRSVLDTPILPRMHRLVTCLNLTVQIPAFILAFKQGAGWRKAAENNGKSCTSFICYFIINFTFETF